MYNPNVRVSVYPHVIGVSHGTHNYGTLKPTVQLDLPWNQVLQNNPHLQGLAEELVSNLQGHGKISLGSNIYIEELWD
jgi:hypothetical protein